MATQLAIGLMSGTSLDGADAVLVRFEEGVAPHVLGHAYQPFDAGLRSCLLALQVPQPNELHDAWLAGRTLARHYGGLVDSLLTTAAVARDAVVVVGAHGQTVRHRPELGYTIQINAPADLAEVTGIDVVADFRSADVAAGGQGAPLVPAFHAEVFSTAMRERAIVNLGGMANLTHLPRPGGAQAVRGWDCGPGNVLLDYWAEANDRGRFDADGAWARTGCVDDDLLARLLDVPWLEVAPPKSTGRELFNPQWLKNRLQESPQIAAADIQATLAQFTALCIARSAAAQMPGIDELVVCGGGAYNTDLMTRLASAMTLTLGHPVDVFSSQRLGVRPDQVEAIAFAWLALRRVWGLPGNLPAVTGAAGPRLLGALHGAPDGYTARMRALFPGAG